jgi:hypothetical protein
VWLIPFSTAEAIQKRWDPTLTAPETGSPGEDRRPGLMVRWIPTGSIVLPGLSGSSGSHNRAGRILSLISRLSWPYPRIWRKSINRS